ncbi:N-acetyltransferase [Staphylococcus muscae]|uniref:GNAT family acetyltransferase n=1 Tax=Staphylococcus muscae TaxID=1294 RepID=A0A240C6W8_9STAP|nr:GNAT family N-acetyltransferase [Staphylococcus muscae]AVQ33644.1 N-acetyltransferase [Staphylococcus muscae]PNZ06426.1 N-acetyltransferase [Staphylococcus muscae]GGA86535.1 N-acetyltransferase [Staphylococcus muscae]SNW03694.1 GNAT family acetyltransferase [Staphylococcus muscae]
MKTNYIQDFSHVATFIQDNLSKNQSYVHKLPVDCTESLQTYLSNADYHHQLHTTQDSNGLAMVLICTPYAEHRYQVIGPIYRQGATFTEHDLKQLFESATAHHHRPSTYYFSFSTAHPAIKSYMKSIGAAYTFTDYHLEATQDLGESERDHLIIDYQPVYFRHLKKLHEKAFQHSSETAETIVNHLDDSHKLFLYVEEGLLKGYLYLVLDAQTERAEIKYFSSHTDYRLRGIAFDLIQHAIHHACQDNDIQTVHFKIRSKNHQLVSRFDTLGFHIKESYDKFKCHF